MSSSNKFKTKFFLSRKKVREQVRKLDFFDGVCFSWKTNPDVGQVILEEGLAEFSITSKNELFQFLSSGGQISIDKVWFFALAIDFNDLDEIFETGVRNFVIENVYDLEVLKNYISEKKIKINVLLRMKLRENSVFTGKHFIFGMKTDVIKKEILELYKNDFFEKIGVHFHRKTQNVSEWNLLNEVKNSIGDILDKIDILNLGGGLPANYKNIHDRALIGIFEKIQNLIDYVKEFGCRVVIEPGRFIAASSLILKTKIVLIQGNCCFVDWSIFNGALDTVIANIKLNILEEVDSGERFMIKGITPDSSDIIRYSVMLNNPKVGDVITFLDAGAYNYQTNFCALEKIETVVLEDFENEK
jgi:ornithine decarboxylase